MPAPDVDAALSSSPLPSPSSRDDDVVDEEVGELGIPATPRWVPTVWASWCFETNKSSLSATSQIFSLRTVEWVSSLVSTRAHWRILGHICERGDAGRFFPCSFMDSVALVGLLPLVLLIVRGF